MKTRKGKVRRGKGLQTSQDFRVNSTYEGGDEAGRRKRIKKGGDTRENRRKEVTKEAVTKEKRLWTQRRREAMKGK